MVKCPECPEGPFLEDQIVGMAERGMITADAEIVGVGAGKPRPLEDFFDSRDRAAKQEPAVEVEVMNFRMRFAQMVELIFYGSLAAIPAAIALGAMGLLLFLLLTLVFGGMPDWGPDDFSGVLK